MGRGIFARVLEKTLESLGLGVFGIYSAWFIHAIATVSLVGASDNHMYGAFVLVFDILDMMNKFMFVYRGKRVLRRLPAGASDLLEKLIDREINFVVVAELAEVMSVGLF